VPPFFRKSQFTWQCDKCGTFFSAGAGGVCRSCKRALCDQHLYGSFWQKLKARFSSDKPVCVACRASVKSN